MQPELDRGSISSKNKGMRWWAIALSSWGIFVFALFAATAVGQTVSRMGGSQLFVHGLQAILLTSIVVPSLYWLLKKSGHKSFHAIGLSSARRAVPQFMTGAGLVIILSGSGFAIAEWLDWIHIKEFHFSMQLLSTAMLNVVIAFFYEALPEELSFRGAVYSALGERFNRIAALFLQPVLFTLAPVAVTGLHHLTGFEPAAISVDYIILLLTFGFILQLLRLVTDSLWTSIGFHLAYLFTTRFIVLQREARFLTYEEMVPGTGELFIIFVMTLLVGILILLTLGIVRRRSIGWRKTGGYNYV
ncbi:CPBP family intramembrane glutamic endopeptidase [Brevibacillus formosus]|uniref:CPBP family intramembrane glutamic endopeptidase n=1 Tax=Brevibacillus formosus TaxID=54913 RepID=UPI0018CFA742|nr:CPBP family intramembrane glutamic endopeptidase [Brevibacillus formosus]MBG9942743.1 CAAX protease [Brevibacillus formosus]